MPFRVSSIFLIALLCAGCATPRARSASTALPATGAAVRGDMLVTSTWLAARLDDAGVVILHVADERRHFVNGHVPGARFLDAGELAWTRDGIPNELPPVEKLVDTFTRLGVGDDSRIVLYGDRMGLAAARAYFTLAYLGHAHRTAVLDGGLEKWRREGREVSRLETVFEPGSFTPDIQGQLVVSLPVMRDYSWVAGRVTDSSLAIIDARPPDEFRGDTPGEGIERPGHIPGAVNIFWRRNVAAGEPTMRPEAELRTLYEAAGATEGGTVVTYCRTGGQGAHAWFTARYLGYDARLYDGSYYEWSEAGDTPIER